MSNRSIHLGIRLYRNSNDYRHRALEKWYDSLPSLDDKRKRGCQDAIINALYAAVSSGQVGAPTPPDSDPDLNAADSAATPSPTGTAAPETKKKPGKKPGSFRSMNF